MMLGFPALTAPASLAEPPAAQGPASAPCEAGPLHRVAQREARLPPVVTILKGWLFSLPFEIDFAAVDGASPSTPVAYPAAGAGVVFTIQLPRMLTQGRQP
jgi:hypothetical protein